MKNNFKGRARLLRKVLVPIIALLIAATAFSQTPCSSPVDRKEVVISDPFHEIEGGVRQVIVDVVDLMSL